MEHFCTYFDSGFLQRGLALYESLKRHCEAFRLHVLCMDADAYRHLSHADHPYLVPIPLEEMERSDRQLAAAKPSRTKIEYYFTCTPSLPLYIFGRHPGIERITYLDADLFFFSRPRPVLDEMRDASIAIIDHRFSKKLLHRYRYGRYNVGWISFRHDAQALQCLRWWRRCCIEWCHDRLEDGRFADQKYLDDWPARFEQTVVIRHKGANLAPWNLENYAVRWKNQQVWVDDHPLVFFHFHGFRQLNRWIYDPNLIGFKARLSHTAKHRIFIPYIKALTAAAQAAGPYGRSTIPDGSRFPLSGLPPGLRLYKVLDRIAYTCRLMGSGDFLFVHRGNVV